jgi:prevent-host-death family protein
VLPRTYTTAEARAQFSTLLKQVKESEVLIARHGEPQAVLVSAEKYEQLLSALEELEEALLSLKAEATLKRVRQGEKTFTFEEVFGEKQ